MKPVHIALLFSQSDANATLSYQHGWPKAFSESPLFSCELFNLAGRGILDRVEIARSLHRGRFDAIVILHSVFSNQQNLRGFLQWALSLCPQPKAYFIGNEYKLMPEKMKFCRQLGVGLLITQSNDPRVQGLYEHALGCRVACIPNTGCDEKVFYPVRALPDRTIDIGYRSYPGTWYLGNVEKTEIAEYFSWNASCLGLTTDISLDPKARFDARGYADFLNRCRGQIGTESGGDFFELTDTVRGLVNSLLECQPETTWPEVRQQFFDHYGPSIPMRIISGRQVEAAACKTVQILFEGRYNELLCPDEHYISLKKDFSNIAEVMEKFRDDTFCARLIDNSYEVVLSELTYGKLVGQFRELLNTVL
jgi:hypothetical protein